MNGLPTKAASVERTRAEVLHEDVRPRDQAVEDGAAGGGPEVERHALLVPVDAQKVGALLTDERWPPLPGVVALTGLLYLDHAGAEVGEHHRAIGSRQDARQVDHGQAR